ncbi:unnamed protein product [Fraxinus pennsylvanica]|uniref:NADH:ubiquinone reductase (non-electrogenic) n=1 Tax=Fraxinus pennsylvanica TaxID=56036 RepID=A0AAD1YVG9_9LAMI|nr:unnamed protein product [Fraxinus pennsylvanica]
MCQDEGQVAILSLTSIYDSSMQPIASQQVSSIYFQLQAKVQVRHVGVDMGLATGPLPPAFWHPKTSIGGPRFPSDSDINFGYEEEDEDYDEDVARRGKMKCLSCNEEYVACDAGTYRECYGEADKTDEELKREIEDLKAKVNFLRLFSAGSDGTIPISRSNTLAFSDVVLIASSSTDFADPQSNFPSILAHRAVLVCGGGLLGLSDGRTAHADADHGDINKKKKKVVVLGTGWAGTSFLKNLKDPGYDVQVVSPRNYFAFTPLLPSVTNGTVEARSIVEPIRNIVRKKKFNVQFKEAECHKIDTQNKKVYCRSIQDNNLGVSEEFSVEYDYLVIAMGARVNTFNTPGVVEHAHFLKEIEDAQRIRRTVIDCFERACLPTVSEEERKRILHFVIVGGGPTGVEFAAELHDFVIDDLAKLYPTLKDYVKITLLEATDHILNMFDKRITVFAEEKFRRDGIDLKTGSMVTKVSDKEISIKETATGQNVSIPYGMVVWSTGIGTRPVITDFMKQIGQVAAQQGAYLADCFNRMEICEMYPEGPLRFRGSGRHRFRPFRYKHLGQFAPLGGEQAAAQLPGDWVSIGHSSQWLWYSVYARAKVQVRHVGVDMGLATGPLPPAFWHPKTSIGGPRFPSDSYIDFGYEEEDEDYDEDGFVARRGKMKCLSCNEEYVACDAGTCRECYEEADKTDEELKRDIEDLKAKLRIENSNFRVLTNKCERSATENEFVIAVKLEVAKDGDILTVTPTLAVEEKENVEMEVC